MTPGSPSSVFAHGRLFDGSQRSIPELPSLPWLLTIALAIRLAWALAVGVVPTSDPSVYDLFARTLVEHGVYGFDAQTPTAFWAVGTAAIYAVGYLILGPGPVAVIGLNLVAGLAIVALTVRLGTLWGGASVGRLSGLIVALWPTLIQFTTLLNSELFFTVLLLGALLVWGPTAPSARRASITGVILGLATLVRPVALLLPIVFAIGAFGRAKPARIALAFAVSALCLGLVLTPWSQRNQSVFGERVLVSTNFGVNFWMGNNPETTGRYQPLPPGSDFPSETARSDHFKALALDYIREDPGAFATRTVVKALGLYRQETIGTAWNTPAITDRLGAGALFPLKLLSTGYYSLCLALALGGMGLLLWRHGVRVLISPPFVLIGYVTALHAVIFISDRFHIPLNPIFAILAAGFILHVGQTNQDSGST